MRKKVLYNMVSGFSAAMTKKKQLVEELTKGLGLEKSNNYTLTPSTPAVQDCKNAYMYISYKMLTESPIIVQSIM